MTINPDTTLAELVIDRPELAARLDGMGLDYCCGGHRRLDQAVVEAGLDLEATVEALEEAPVASAEAEWDDMQGLVDHLLTTHHAYLHEALPRLVALADKVAGVHGENHPELARVASLAHEIQADLEPHMMKEERVLFPMITSLLAGSARLSSGPATVSAPIRVMALEHDRVGELLARLREQTNGYHLPDDACASYDALYRGLAELEADTHLHVHKENNLLFPAAIEAEQVAVAAAERTA